MVRAGSAVNVGLDQKQYALGCTLLMIVFPIALVVYGFSGCDMRHRSQKSACTEGDAQQCIAVAKLYQDDAIGLVPFLLSNFETAKEYYDRACTLGDMAGCEGLSQIIMNGHGEAARDSRFGLKEASVASDKACDGGYADACYEAGLFYIGDLDMPADVPRANALFARACAGKNADGCYSMGVSYALGRGGLARDLDRAASFFADACDAGDGKGCEQATSYRTTGKFK
jgi:TPR repeat protein